MHLCFQLWILEKRKLSLMPCQRKRLSHRKLLSNKETMEIACMWLKVENWAALNCSQAMKNQHFWRLTNLERHLENWLFYITLQGQQPLFQTHPLFFGSLIERPSITLWKMLQIERERNMKISLRKSLSSLQWSHMKDRNWLMLLKKSIIRMEITLLSKETLEMYFTS